LDHALGNAAALEKTVDVSEWHINADEPIALDYNTDFKSDGQITSYYAADAYRMSDHDPVIISMQLDAPVVEEEDEADDDNGSGGSLGFLWLALLGLVAIRRKS
jgi:predicted extracellular nuclease